MKRILKLAVFGIAAIAALSSCSKNEDVPSQKDIETKIIGKWKSTSMNGKEDLTNNKVVKTFLSNNKCTHSTSRYYNGKFLWQNKVPYQYEIKGNELTENLGEDGTLRLLLSKVTSINEATLCYHSYKSITPEGGEKAENDNCNFQKVTADYSQDIIGMWEGVEMTGDETYGDANHRIEYKADGTYTYYDKVGDSWVPSKNAGNEYNVDGDWLATRWQPTEGADYEYEWWDIVEIKDGTMKWSALREKGDKTRYTTTFTWKKVNLPTQEEIETKIIGKWKSIQQNGKDNLTNERTTATFFDNGKEERSTSRYFEGVGYLWSNKNPYHYEIKGNSLTQKNLKDNMIHYAKVLSINNNSLNYLTEKIVTEKGEEIFPNDNIFFQKVTADYSQDIIGMWEGVEMTGDETYGDANHRIEYKADGTYTYYDKVGDSWVLSKNAGNEYNVDGDWLATRWQPTEGADYEYEWWDIAEIKDGTMKWSALREKGDKTRYTTTFTWKKVNLPTQEEIETKIIGKWKEIVTEGKDALTNGRTIRTFYTGNKATHSCSRIYDGNYAWYNKSPFKYEVNGCDMCESSEENSFKTFSKVMSIDESKLSANYYKEILPEGQERGININAIYQKVTADYSQDIIGMWEGVEMTGDETYGDANHRIEYKADGTYVYYDKDGDDWKLSEDVDNEYNVDGDWLASRWRPKSGADYEYEWWDIVEIKDGTMKWSALREKEDGTRYTTTFTWKKIN